MKAIQLGMKSEHALTSDKQEVLYNWNDDTDISVTWREIEKIQEIIDMPFGENILNVE